MRRFKQQLSAERCEEILRRGSYGVLAVVNDEQLDPDDALRAAARGKAEHGSLFPDYRLALRLHFNPRNYYRSAEGIRIFYQMQTLAPANEGIVEFLLAKEKE